MSIYSTLEDSGVIVYTNDIMCTRKFRYRRASIHEYPKGKFLFLVSGNYAIAYHNTSKTQIRVQLPYVQVGV